MAVLYLHIPFCKQACHYCDFHFTTNLGHLNAMVQAICEEIHLRANYLEDKSLKSVYFGGGTPSLLQESHLKAIWDAILTHFTLEPNAEVTLEANPDDLTPENLAVFKNNGVNRLSIGIQSFDQNHLAWMHRAHTSAEAANCIEAAQAVGFKNISLDLIYGIPALSHHILYTDLEKICAYKVPHISAYCLTIEPGTAFGKWQKAGKLPSIPDQFALEQLDITYAFLAQKGYEPYEISNFAKNEAYSQHNTAYWFQKPYLGVGPSAHSYNGLERCYNIANNAKYLTALSLGQIPGTTEVLSKYDVVNEVLMTQLRTKWGVQIKHLDTLSEGQFMKENHKTLAKFYDQKLLDLNNGSLYLTQKGIHSADFISSELFLV
jgi:oxygen-independent coproporphyrinogen III oxidase